MNSTFMMITIAIVTLATMLTRFLPFVIFPDAKRLPKFISYLSDVLPFAVIGILVVYCLRNLNLENNIDILYHSISIMFIVILHIWKKNVLLSILGGTICYMFLLNIF